MSRWFAQRYNAVYAWIFNGTTRYLDNNNVNNRNQVGALTNLQDNAMTDEQIYTFMLATVRNARRNKRYGRDCAEFERLWAPSLVRMMRQLQDKTFRVDRNYAFLVSKPKWREIFATSFEGRVADHLLCDTLAPYIERELHPRTFNNRKGMGAQAAINRVIEDIYEVSEGYTGLLKARPAYTVRARLIRKYNLKTHNNNAKNRHKRTRHGAVQPHQSAA